MIQNFTPAVGVVNRPESRAFYKSPLIGLSIVFVDVTPLASLMSL